MPQLETEWKWRSWQELKRDELYALLHLRSRVFIVEQQDPYNDIDGLDPQGIHLLSYKAGELVAYGRLLPPGVKREEAVVGRICIAKEHRGRKLIYQLLMEKMRYIYAHLPDADIYGYTQTHWISGLLRNGAVPISSPQSKSRIEHVEVLLKNEKMRELIESELVGKQVFDQDEEIIE